MRFNEAPLDAYGRHIMKTPVDDLAGTPDAILRQQLLADVPAEFISVYTLIAHFDNIPRTRFDRLLQELLDAGEVERFDSAQPGRATPQYRRAPEVPVTITQAFELKPGDQLRWKKSGAIGRVVVVVAGSMATVEFDGGLRHIDLSFMEEYERVVPSPDPVTPPTQEAQPMAKKTNAPDPDQLELIDVDDPKLKSIKKELMEYDALLVANREEASASRDAEKAKRNKVLEKAKAAGISPGADGAYHLKFGGLVWNISQQAQLKIKKSKAPREESPEPAEDDGEGKDAKAPELQTKDRR